MTAALTVVAGCSTVASGDLHTSGIIAHISVAATSSGAQVIADLTAGGTTSVELGPKDSLVATSGTQHVTLRESTLFGLHEYAATLPVTPRPGTLVRVELRRADDEPASSSVHLPGPVGVRAPHAGARVSRSHDLQVVVGPGPGAIRVDWKGSCVGTGEIRFEEGGPAVVPAGSLQKVAPASGAPAVPDACDVTLSVTRVLDGRLAASYKRGGIEGVRTQAVVIRSVA